MVMYPKFCPRDKYTLAPCIHIWYNFIAIKICDK